MAIKFDTTFGKTLKFPVERLDTKDASFVFRITIEGVEYGFPGKLNENNKVEVNIPPLDNILKEVSVVNAEAKLDAILNGRHYSVPWTENVEIIAAPKLELGIVEESTSNGILESDTSPRVRLQEIEEVEGPLESQVNLQESEPDSEKNTSDKWPSWAPKL